MKVALFSPIANWACMKKFSVLVVCLFLPLTGVKAYDEQIYSHNAILYNMDTNQVLYQKNSNEIINIASLTKITTAIVAIEHISSLDDTVVITSNDLAGLKEADASVAGFRIGETVTYRDLLYGVLLPSGADATQALAYNISGNTKDYVELMNQKAQALGLKNTHYVNTSGLDIKNHYSTVEEVATMLQYALQNKTFYEIFTTSEYTTTDGSISMKSTTKGYSDKYHLNIDYIKGAKTGYTAKAGYCLSSIATIDNAHYLLVTAGGFSSNKQPYHFIDTINIYNYYGDNYQYYPVIKKGDLLTTIDVKYAKEDVSIYSKEDVYRYLSNKEIEQLTYQYTGSDVISPFVKKGTILGNLEVKVNENMLATQEIVLPNSLSFSLGIFLKANLAIILITLLVILFLMKGVKHGKRKKR